MTINNLNINPAIMKKGKMKLATLALTTTLVATMLTGCSNNNNGNTLNTDTIDDSYANSYYSDETLHRGSINKAIMFDGNRAVIIEISKWTDTKKGMLQLITKDGLLIITSLLDTKLFDDTDTKMSAEDFAIIYKGEDIEIVYWDEIQKTKTR